MNIRAATPEDLPALAVLLAEEEADVEGRPSHISVGDVREWTSRTDLTVDSWLFEADGQLAAAGWFDLLPGEEVGFAAGVVHPGWKAKGLGTQLVDRSEERARHYGAKRLHQFALAKDAAAVQLFTDRGYYEVRRFYEMAIDLEEPPEAPPFGIETLDVEQAAAFYAALDEAFQDHWEHHSTPFDEWWARHASNPGFDPSLWFVIREGDEMVAVSRNEANRNGGGYVASIGVRRPWRGKGYAKALLLHTFREFYERGLTRVTLGVDSENPTGATHLYERVGMHVEQENIFFEKSFS